MHRQCLGLLRAVYSLLGEKMTKKCLAEWLEWIKKLHTKEIDLGLERVSAVAARLGLSNSECPIVIVGGTNGKGSCVAGLEAIYLAAGKRVGAFTSPFLFQYNEQVRVQGVAASDEAFCDAFVKVAAACADVTLTPFEFGTLAALIIFKAANLDVWILEVGLGGRYDAVNIVAADVAIIASISLDHTELLGNTREAIGREKAGIFRADKSAVCGDYDPPQTVLTEKVKKLYCQNKQFGFKKTENSWSWWSETQTLPNLPLPTLALQNMATVLMAIEILQTKLPVTYPDIVTGLKKINLPGRIQVVPGPVTVIYDVSHNPASAQYLVDYLQSHPCYGKTHAVFSMLADKDIVTTLKIVKTSVDNWNIAPLPIPRGATEEILSSAFAQAGIIKNKQSHSSLEKAFVVAQTHAQPGDRIVVFGSFHTVASVSNKK
jgi:dihydrofolate synthase/folylpolyglutamate synthase